jgi:hypothetical protein
MDLNEQINEKIPWISILENQIGILENQIKSKEVQIINRLNPKKYKSLTRRDN